jgi:polyisoprenoid-binding protein YceI
MNRISFFVLSALIFSAGSLASPRSSQAAEWTLDAAHSSVGFVARHLGLSKVRGAFGAFDLRVEADPAGKIISAKSSVQIDSVDTGMEKRDVHLKGADFFDQKAHPTMSFVSQAVKFEAAKVDGKVQLKLIGDLTIKGVTKRVIFEGEFVGTRVADFGGGPTTRAGYEFHATINRQNFGLSFNAMAEGTAIVSDLIEIDLALEIYREGK